MESIFSEITPLDFITVSSLFLLAMIIFLGVKNRKYLWLNYVLLVVFVLQWALIVAFREQLATKLFATLMLLTTVVVELAIKRRRKFSGTDGPA
jgi:uncharacterized membrane protein YjdF